MVLAAVRHAMRPMDGVHDGVDTPIDPVETCPHAADVSAVRACGPCRCAHPEAPESPNVGWPLGCLLRCGVLSRGLIEGETPRTIGFCEGETRGVSVAV